MVSFRSAWEDYGNDAIINVQLLSRDGLCEIIARIVSKHQGTYNVAVIINESEG